MEAASFFDFHITVHGDLILQLVGVALVEAAFLIENDLLDHAEAADHSLLPLIDHEEALAPQQGQGGQDDGNDDQRLFMPVERAGGLAADLLHLLLRG